jgi:hypothetical protein
MKSKISANGRPRNWEDQGMSLYTRNFQSKGQEEEKMTWRALLSYMASKVHNFWVPRIFNQAHLKRWAWLKIRGILRQNSHNQSISILSCYISKNILKIWIVHFLAPSHFTLHPKAVSWKAGFSRMGQGPWEVFRAASHFKCKAGLRHPYLTHRKFDFRFFLVLWIQHFIFFTSTV